jgi:hypothetical protein
MMQVLPCADVREHLAAYHDGELDIEAQVRIHGHLQECVACRIEAAAIADLGAALRTMAGSVPYRAAAESRLFTDAVLDRIRVEQRFSLVTRLRESFEDMHLVWAGLGATMAMLFCIFASAGVLHAANQERPDSLAGIISTIASGATDPVRLVDSAYENQPLLDTSESLPLGGGTDLMLSAFVTHDGRIQNVSLLEEQAVVKPEVVLAMIDAASRARFLPMQSSAYPGGVNVVWLVTSTTVKGAPDYDLYLLAPPRLAKPVFGPPTAPKPAPTPAVKSNTPAGGDCLAA